MVGGNDPFGNLEAIKIRDSICPFIGVGSTSGVGSVTVDGRVDGVGSVSGVGTDVTNEAVITVVTVSCAFTLSVGRSEDIKAFDKSFILFFFRGCVEHDKDISGVIVDVSAGVNVIAFFCLRIGRIGCVGASGVGVVCGIGDDAGACRRTDGSDAFSFLFRWWRKHDNMLFPMTRIAWCNTKIKKYLNV